MKVTRVIPQGQTLSGSPLALLDLTFTEDEDDVSDLAWSDEVYVVGSGC